MAWLPVVPRMVEGECILQPELFGMTRRMVCGVTSMKEAHSRALMWSLVLSGFQGVEVGVSG